MFPMSCQYASELPKAAIEKAEVLEEVSGFDFGAMLAEEVFFKYNMLNIVFSDLKGVGHSFYCDNIKIRITPACFAVYNTDYYNPGTIGRIWEVKNSRVIAELNKAVEEYTEPGDQMRDLMQGLDKGGERHPGVKHYILPLQNYLIEIIAAEGDLKEVERTPFEDLSYRPKEKREIRWKERNFVPRSGWRYLTEAVKAKASDFKLHSTPLENFAYNRSGLEIYVDDRSEQRYKISFDKCLKVDIMDTDVASVMTNYYQVAGYTLIEVENSKLIDELKSQTTEPSMLAQLERSKHYVLPMRDNLVEVVAEDIAIEKAPNRDL